MAYRPKTKDYGLALWGWVVIERFEDSEAWKMARILSKEIYRLSSTEPFARDFKLRDQIRSSSVSVMANIAEGLGRNGDKELRQFFGHAKGSAAETKSHLYAAPDAEHIDKAAFDGAYSFADQAEKPIAGFIKYLNSSQVGGLKFRDGHSSAHEDTAEVYGED